MSRLLAALRSPIVKWLFLAMTLALAGYAVWSRWEEVASALAQLSPLAVAAAFALAACYVWLTLLSWRRVLADLGSPLRLPAAIPLFGVSQLGKYIPGGVWNVLVAAELGAEHKIPRRRSVTAMALAILISLVSGLALGGLALALGPDELVRRWRWAAWLLIPLVIALAPPVMNRLIELALRLARRPPPEQPMTTRGLAVATGWAMAAWVVAGAHVWVLAIGLGLEASPRSLALATGAYALAWVVGFVVVIAPAGAGAREAVLIAALSGALGGGAVLTVVLLSRVLLTVADFGIAGWGMILARHRRPRISP